jgi:hypothetical protein
MDVTFILKWAKEAFWYFSYFRPETISQQSRSDRTNLLASVLSNIQSVLRGENIYYGESKPFLVFPSTNDKIISRSLSLFPPLVHNAHP